MGCLAPKEPHPESEPQDLPVTWCDSDGRTFKYYVAAGSLMFEEHQGPARPVDQGEIDWNKVPQGKHLDLKQLVEQLASEKAEDEVRRSAAASSDLVEVQPDLIAQQQTLLLQAAQAAQRRREEEQHVAARRDRAEQEELSMAIAASLLDKSAETSSGSRKAAPASSTWQELPPSQDQPLSADETLDAAMLKLNEVVANCLQLNTQFVDPEFVPSPKVLYCNGRCRRSDADQLLIVQHYERSHGREIQWRRPGEIFQRPDDLMMEFDSREDMINTMRQIARFVEWKVFQSDPKATDISQGALGNCWFCGSLAAVAEKPTLVKRLFVDDNSKNGDLSPVGVYLVRLCDGGEWRYVLLDDQFPCNSSSMLAYSGARRNQLWVPLVEKAFAKMRGNYEETEGGNPSEGLRLMTGWPSIVLRLQRDPENDAVSASDEMAMRVQATCPFVDEEILWVRLMSAYSANQIICGACGHVEGLTKEMYREAGLSPSHCYSIVQVAAARGGALRLAKLRNPWGTGLKWKGDFSDGDTANWTPEVKAEVGATDLGTDGGIFWMKLEDLLRYFNSITICPFREGWKENRFTSTFPSCLQGPQPGFFFRKLPGRGSSTDTLFSMMQPEERQSGTTMTADLGFALFQVHESDVSKAIAGSFGADASVRRRLTFVDSIRRQVHDTVLSEQFLEEAHQRPGLLVVPLSFNHRAPCFGAGGGYPDKRFTFTCFSAQAVPMKTTHLAPELMRDALVAHTCKHGSSSSQGHGVRICKLQEAGLAVYLENASSFFVEITTQLTEVFNLTVSRGVQASSDGQLFLESCDVLPPMHGMIVFIAAAMPGGHSYRFSSRLSFRHDGSSAAHMPPLAEPTDPFHSPFFLDKQ